MKEILEKVLAQFTSDEVDGHIEEVNGADTLRLLPTGFGPNHDNTVVMEICRIPMEDVDDCVYIQFYTTIVVDVDKESYADILLQLNEINLSALLGNYGILSESGMIYHKAIMRLPLMSDDELAKAIIDTAYDCFAIIDYNYEQVSAIFE